MVTVWQGNALGYAGRCFAPAVKSDSVLPESIAGSGWGWILAGTVKKPDSYIR